MEFYTTRFKSKAEITYTIEVVTPLFLGGADPDNPELRAAPFKGILRFWWRALYGSNCIDDIKKRETEIFGSTKEKSKLSISVHPSEIKTGSRLPPGDQYIANHNGGQKQGDILKYLSIGVWKRNFIESGSSFSLTITSPETEVENIRTSLDYFFNLHGIGSKSRNGFGCLQNKNAQKAKIEFHDDLKKYTAISREAKLFQTNETFSSWDKALSDIGIKYYKARQSLEKPHSYYRRSLIGKPIVTANDSRIRNGRHSKPYFLHVIKLADNKYRGQILFLPYEYHEKEQRESYFRACMDMNDKLSSLFSMNQGGDK